ncbi:holo-ACP synthase [Calditerricola satsumensis]
MWYAQARLTATFPASEVLAVRIGVDIVDIARMQALAADERFVARVFTPAERALLDGLPPHRQAEVLAGRFAAKEAAAKALGTGFAGGIRPLDIETLRGPSGEPVLQLHGEARRRAKTLGLRQWHVSLSHTRDVAVAFVVLTGDTVPRAGS